MIEDSPEPASEEEEEEEADKYVSEETDSSSEDDESIETSHDSDGVEMEDDEDLLVPLQSPAAVGTAEKSTPVRVAENAQSMGAKERSLSEGLRGRKQLRRKVTLPRRLMLLLLRVARGQLHGGQLNRG